MDVETGFVGGQIVGVADVDAMLAGEPFGQRLVHPRRFVAGDDGEPAHRRFSAERDGQKDRRRISRLRFLQTALGINVANEAEAEVQRVDARFLDAALGAPIDADAAPNEGVAFQSDGLQCGGGFLVGGLQLNAAAAREPVFEFADIHVVEHQREAPVLAVQQGVPERQIEQVVLAAVDQNRQQGRVIGRCGARAHPSHLSLAWVRSLVVSVS